MTRGPGLGPPGGRTGTGDRDRPCPDATMSWARMANGQCPQQVMGSLAYALRQASRNLLNSATKPARSSSSTGVSWPLSGACWCRPSSPCISAKVLIALAFATGGVVGERIRACRSRSRYTALLSPDAVSDCCVSRPCPGLSRCVLSRRGINGRPTKWGQDDHATQAARCPARPAPLRATVWPRTSAPCPACPMPGRGRCVGVP
jgi:hypothetical protein